MGPRPTTRRCARSGATGWSERIRPEKLKKETREALIESIKRYAAEELEIEIGDLKAGLLLDYVLEEVGPTVYNEAIQDARAYFFDKVEDLEGSCFQPELGYWPKRDR